MDPQAFIDWALDDARTVEERYALELLVEQGAGYWGAEHKIYRAPDWETRMERQRQRALNPAYQPQFSETAVRHTAEVLHRFKTWWYSGSYNDRPIRDLKAFGFLTELEEFKMNQCAVADVSVLATLPKLRVLHLSSAECEDLSPLAGCRQLRELSLSLGKSGLRVGTHWPHVAGLERLEQLQTLSLHGNLLAFAPGLVWPRVRTAALHCDPLPARSLRELPQLPACEILTLGGVERLDGIEAFPRLRNLTLATDTRSFAPLVALKELTCFTCSGFAPLDVRPLTRLPKLQCVTFNANYEFNLTAPKPRDFAPFADAPLLRELIVAGCPPVAAEVATLNALLLPWDEELLAPAPRPLPAPLRLIVAPTLKIPRHNTVQLNPDDHGLADAGLRKAEGAWTGRFLAKAISDKLGSADWGKAEADGNYRTFFVTVEAYAVVEKFQLIVEAIRQAIARLRYDYVGSIMIHLISPVPEPTPAQVELQKKFDEEQEKAEWERSQKERQELLERLHRLDLKKQLGEEIKPEDFVAPPPTPLPPPPWERDDAADDDEDDDNAGLGGISLKEKVEPPPDPWDNDHPLADKYRLLVQLTLAEMWIMPHQRDLAIYLMGRQPDQEIPEDPAPQ